MKRIFLALVLTCVGATGSVTVSCDKLTEEQSAIAGACIFALNVGTVTVS